MIHSKTISNTEYKMILSNEKKFDICISDTSKTGVSVGDIIIYYNKNNEDQRIFADVTETIMFNSFTDLTKAINVCDLGFHDLNISDLELLYLDSKKQTYNDYSILTYKISIKEYLDENPPFN